MNSCAISLLTTHLLDVDGLFFSAHLDYLADSLTSIVSSNHPDLVVLVDGHEQIYFCCSSLESRDGMVFLCTWGDTEVMFVIFVASWDQEGVKLHANDNLVPGMLSNTFSCVCWPFVYLLWRNIYSSPLPIFFFFFFWPHGMWEPTRDWTHGPCSGSHES